MNLCLSLLRSSSRTAGRLWPAVGTAFFAAAATLAGCSQTQPVDPLGDVAGFCEQKASGECQVAEVCTLDVKVCTNARIALCMSDAASAMASGTRSYDENNAKACINAVNQAYGDMTQHVPYATLEGPGSIGDLCNRVFTGNLAQGTPCKTDYDCEGSGICAPVAPQSTISVCAVASAPIALGGFCENPGSVCATDLYCAPQPSLADQCVAAAGLGASCANGVACVSAAQCGASQTCIARQGLGDGCSSDDQCDPSSAPFCDPADHLCSVGLTFAAGSFDCNGFIQTGGGSSTVATPTADAASPPDAAEVDAAAASDASSD
jgi:hypothetical protein